MFSLVYILKVGNFMKKLIALLMVVFLGVSLCACGTKTSKEDLIVEANRLAMKQDANYEALTVSGEFDEDYGAYCVIVSLDKDYWCQTYSADSLEGGAMLAMAENSYEETINTLVESLFNETKEIFADSDVDVVVGYKDRQGEFTNIHSTLE